MKRLIAALLLIVVLAMPASAASKCAKNDISSAPLVYLTNYVVDSETGVNYIVITGYPGSHSAASVSICPRYNADGSLFVTEVENQ